MKDQPTIISETFVNRGGSPELLIEASVGPYKVGALIQSTGRFCVKNEYIDIFALLREQGVDPAKSVGRHILHAWTFYLSEKIV